MAALWRLSFHSLLLGAALGVLERLLHQLFLILTLPLRERLPRRGFPSWYLALFERRKAEGKGRFRRPLRFLFDFFLALTLFVSLILLLYAENDGAFRLFVPLLMAVGFFLAEKLLGTFLLRLGDFFPRAVLFSVLSALFPVALVLRLCLFRVFFPIWRLFGKIALPIIKFYVIIYNKYRAERYRSAECTASALSKRYLKAQKTAEKEKEKPA